MQPGASESPSKPAHCRAWYAIRAFWFWGYVVYVVLDIRRFQSAGEQVCAGQDCAAHPLWIISPPGAPAGVWLGILLVGLLVRLMFAAVIIALGVAAMSWIERRIRLGSRVTPLSESGDSGEDFSGRGSLERWPEGASEVIDHDQAA